MVHRRTLEEHQRQEAMSELLSDSSTPSNPTVASMVGAELHDQERLQVEQKVLLANLQASFDTSPPPKIAGPHLGVLQMRAMTLLAQSLALRTSLHSRTEVPVTPAREYTTFPGTGIQSQLRELYNELSSVLAKEDFGDILISVQKNLLEELELLNELERTWKDYDILRDFQLPTPNTVVLHSTDRHFSRPMSEADPLLVIAIFCVIVVNIFSHVAREPCNLIIRMMKILVRIALARNHAGLIPPHEQRVLDNFPADIRNVRKVLNMEPSLTVFASCLRCHYCHSLNPTEPGQKFPQYPEFCDHVSFPGDPPCGERLVQMETEKRHIHNATLVPLRPYYLHDPKEFIASLASRPGLEAVMDNYWNRVKTAGIFEMEDLGDGSIMKELLDVDMVHRFADGPTEVGRLVFALSIDWFNPYTMRIRGPSVTTGVVVIVCLNLPGRIRYRPENVFPIAMIPGPDEPNLTDINHYFRPFVDSLLELWDPGVFFTHTAAHANGRVYRAALVPLIADYPAIRKALGVKISPRADTKFCIFCDVPRTKIDEWIDRDPSTFPHRNNAEHRQMAYEWRDAATHELQAEAFARNGIRYTELLRLPYWDPTRFMVVDPMHNLFLGLIQSHFRGYLGIKAGALDTNPTTGSRSGQLTNPTADSNSNGQPPTSTSRAKRNPVPQENKARSTLQKFTTLSIQEWRVKMNLLNKPTLDFICHKLSIPIPQFPNRRVQKQDLVELIEPKIQGNPNLYTSFCTTASATGPECIQPTPSIITSQPNMLNPANDSVSSQQSNPNPRTLKHPPVIGPTELNEIQRDIKQLISPSWVTSLPDNFGTPKAGTLKADAWRSALNLFLPLTLIRLWGNLPATDRRRKILDNTMMLLQAIHYASSRTVTEAKAKMYTSTMQTYLKGLRELFPHKALLPNHHMALHIEGCLLRFGPIRGWWSFPFERMIGSLQHINTNWKFGELEKTLLASYCVGSNIRVMFSSDRYPPALHECKQLLNTYLGVDALGSLTIESLHVDSNEEDTFQLDLSGNTIVDINWRKMTLLPDDLYRALCRVVHEENPSRKAFFHKHFILHGRKLSTSDATYRDSLVLYSKAAGGGIVPGVIKSVFTRIQGLTTDRSPQARHYVAIQQFKPLAAVIHDPYLRYAVYGGRIWSVELNSVVDLIDSERIYSQFASCPYGKDMMAVIPVKPS